MSLYKSLSVAERANIHKLYKKVNPNMSYRDIISDFNREESLPQYPDGGNLPIKPKPAVQPYQAKDEADYKYRQQMYSDSLALNEMSKYQFKETRGQKLRDFKEFANMAARLNHSPEIGKAINPNYSKWSDAFFSDQLKNSDLDNYEKNGGNLGSFSKDKDYPKRYEADKGMRDKLSSLKTERISVIDRDSPEFYHKKIDPIGVYNQSPKNGDTSGPVNYFYKKPVQQVLPPPGSNVQNTTQAQVNTTQPNPVSTQPQRLPYQPIEKMPIRGLPTYNSENRQPQRVEVPDMPENYEEPILYTAHNYLKHTNQPIGYYNTPGDKMPMYSREQLERMNKPKSLVSRAYGGYIDWTKRY
jgi:hypothetical protein